MITTVGLSHKNFDSLVSHINSELINVREWTLANRLTLNVSKTNAIIFSTRHLPNHSNFSFSIDSNKIDVVNDVRFLGIYIDSRLNFSKHVDYITGKIARNTGIFNRIKNFLPLKSRINFYYSFVYPYLSYGVIVWGATSHNHLNNLIIQQKRFVRLLADSTYLAHTNPLFSKFKLLKFIDIFKYSVSIYMFSHHSDEEFQTQHQIPTRNRNLLVPSYNRLTGSQRSITYTGPKTWNELPICIRNSKTLSVFKRKLKTHLLEAYDLA